MQEIIKICSIMRALKYFKRSYKGISNRNNFRWVLVLLFCVIVWLIRKPGEIRWHSHKKKVEPSLNLDDDYIVKSPTCRIPNLHPWRNVSEILGSDDLCPDYYNGPPNCLERHPNSWAYVDGQNLVMNLTRMRISGYSWNSILCCYRIIYRIGQTLEQYNMQADNQTKLSKTCYPIKNPTHSVENGEFIQVMCRNKINPSKNLISWDTLLFAKPSKTVQNKIQHWTSGWKVAENEKPPSIIILTIDANSRLNTHRYMKETLQVMKTLDAVGMFGYLKTGTSSYANAVTMLTGYSEKDLGEFCSDGKTKAQDDCPYIWKQFDKAGYLVSPLNEDSPFSGTLNSEVRLGFVKKQGDFYSRPGMINLRRMSEQNETFPRCYGALTSEQVLFNYAADIVKLGKSSSGSPHIPVYIHTWISSLAHHCEKQVLYGDPIVAKFFSEQVDTNNSIIVFMADHGKNFGKLRETLQGWYEASLPSMWIYIPPRIRRQFPEWQEALKINKRRVTSHFDLYRTLVHILKTFDKEGVAKDTYAGGFKQKGQSLFEVVPLNRTCVEAGVPAASCVCKKPQEIDVKSDLVVNATREALKYIENMLPDKCAKPVIKEIVSALTFMGDYDSDASIYIVGFKTDPGSLHFEASMKKNGEYCVVQKIMRVDKIRREQVGCLQEQEKLYKEYCYCK